MRASEAMSGRKQEKGESDDDFQYEEVSLEDEWSLTEGEEDLEATVKAIQDRAEATAAAGAAPRPTATSITHQPEAVDDFLRNFLSQMGMTETLECFQIEWTEMVQRGQVDTNQVGVVPEVYTENQRLESELKNAQREGGEYRLAAAAGAETLLRVLRNRDFHRLRHKRVVQEKTRLIEEMRRLKMQCSTYEPEVKRMNEKYQAALKQIMLLTMERDKALGQAAQHNISAWKDAGEEGVVSSVNMATHRGIQPRPPTPAHAPRSQTRVKSGRANAC